VGSGSISTVLDYSVLYLGVGALHEVSAQGGGGTATLVVAMTVNGVRQYIYSTG